MKESYEIHFVVGGYKKVIIIKRSSMCDLEAWKAALLHHGECAGTTFSIRYISDAVERAEDRGIQKVRWNKATHTVTWSERDKLAQNTVGVKNIE
ncbi:DUF6555 family protein [Pseudomonas sp. XS1P51]